MLGSYIITKIKQIQTHDKKEKLENKNKYITMSLYRIKICPSSKHEKINTIAFTISLF